VSLQREHGCSGIVLEVPVVAMVAETDADAA
jgi:hypothetical protein